MRKRIIGEQDLQPVDSGEVWLDLDKIATVEATSEDSRFPIESVFQTKGGPGWRAAQKGEQRIRVLFDEPASLHRIQLRFQETEVERTQEFSLRWVSAAGASHEIVRQQWNFSPGGSSTEVEEYAVKLEAVSVLELTINPDISRGAGVATLASWRIG